MRSSKINIDALMLPPSSSIRDAIAVIDRGSAGICLVTEGNRLVGVLTDGDIRRALLKEGSLEASVAGIVRRDFLSLPTTASEAQALALMQRELIHQIPALDNSGNVVRLFLLEDLVRLPKLLNSVVVMAGGEGKRLRPLTDNNPKPMLHEAGKPLIEIMLEQCLDAGFENFYFAVNYLKEKIQSHFRDGSAWGAHIQYLEEDKPLGTAGALSLLMHRVKHPFLVVNGDVLSRVDLRHLLRFHAENKSMATLCVREHKTQIPYGIVRVHDAKVVGCEEKPILTHYINAGIYSFEPEVLDFVPKDVFFDMPQLLEALAEKGKLVNAFPVHEYWLDVGHPEMLHRARGDWE